MLQLLREDYSFKYPFMFVAWYSFLRKWNKRNFQSFETAARGFEPRFSRLGARRSNRYVIAPHDSNRHSVVRNM